ncbi:MAG: hypothetical protein WC565_08855 [Parcubacteria group bacterium]
MPNPTLQRIVLSHYGDAERVSERELRELMRLLGLSRRDVEKLLGELVEKEKKYRGLSAAALIRDASVALAGTAMLWRQLGSSTRGILSTAIDAGWSSGLSAAEAVATHMGQALPEVGMQMLDALKTNAIPFADAQTRAIEARIRGELVRGLLNKESTRSIADRMIGAGLQTEGTVWKSAVARAEATIRAETSRAYHAAMTGRFAGADWVTGYQYMTQPEGEWPCSRCEPYHGQFFPKGTEPMLPRHPNCRCVYLVVTEKYGTYSL